MNEQAAPKPSQHVVALDRLVGQWRVEGGVVGTVTYAWMPGRFFLRQDVAIDHLDHQVRGVEIIGHLHPFMGERSEHVHSRFYDSEGNTLDYVYELDGDTLTIWGGEKGSPAYYRGTFSAKGDVLTGSWVYPGGGYDAVQTRID